MSEKYDESKNYKHVLVKLLRQSRKLENGELFNVSMVSPVELSALASYKNIIATGEPFNKQNNSSDMNNHKSRVFYTEFGQILY